MTKQELQQIAITSAVAAAAGGIASAIVTVMLARIEEARLTEKAEQKVREALAVARGRPRQPVPTAGFGAGPYRAAGWCCPPPIL